MGQDSAIQWTDATWNPVTGCQKVSPGCHHCYAEAVADRFWATQYPPVPCIRCEGTGWLQYDPATHLGVECPACDGKGERPRRFTDVQVHPDRLDQPLRRGLRQRIFVNSMSDLFHEDVPDGFVEQVWTVMRAAPQHTFQILTKRPERMAALIGSDTFRELVTFDADDEGELTHPWPLLNVWLGVSVEDQERADERIPLLLDTPAAVRFLSCEPLLGPVDIYHGAGGSGDERIDWLIVGGESGPKARPMDLAWARSLVEQGRAAGVPVFVKQLGSVWARENGAGDRHGGLIEEFPSDLQVRDFPEVTRAA